MSNPNQESAITAKLLWLCNGNEEMLLSLFAHIHKLFPGKSKLWLLSKLLWALEHQLHAIQTTTPAEPDPNDHEPAAPGSRQYQSINQARQRRIHSNPPVLRQKLDAIWSEIDSADA